MYKCFIYFWTLADSVVLLCLVLTSCASLPMTPMRSCTRCWSWPSARAVRASACSDSSITGTVVPPVQVHTSTAHSSALVPCIYLHLTVGFLGREIPRLPLNTLSGWEGITGSPTQLCWNQDSSYELLCYCMYIKYLAFVKKGNHELLKKVRFWLILFLNAEVCLVLYVWKTNDARAKYYCINCFFCILQTEEHLSATAAYMWCGWRVHLQHFGLNRSGTDVCM